MNLEKAPPMVEFDNLSFVNKTKMYCRNVLRLMLRFPVFAITLFIFVVLLLSLHDSVKDSLKVIPGGPYVLLNARADGRLIEGLQLCPHLDRPDNSSIRTLNNTWQYHGSKAEEIIVYSAFFDDRPLLGVSTWIRIVGMATNLSSSGFHCHVWYDDYPMPYVTRGVINVTGRRSGYLFEKKRFIQYLFSCRLPSVEPVPSHVSLTVNQCDSSSILLPVQRPLRTTPDQEFGVCVPVSFGTVPVPVFVEWIELLHLLGVTEFNVYDANMAGMTEVFDLYVSRGWLRVFPAPPALNLTGIDGPKFGSAAALNDCMMRNLYRYRLLLIIDFDEVIVPRMHRNYSAMLEHVDRLHRLTDQHIGYGFRNAYFFRELKPDPAQPPYLRTMAYRTRSEVAKHRVAPKSFIDPLQCLSAFNHFCYLALKPNTTSLYLGVHPSIGVTHHFRICNFSKVICREYYNSSYEDNAALRFKDELGPRVKVALKRLGVLDK